MLLDDQELQRIADLLAEKLELHRPQMTQRLMDIPQTATYLGRTETAIQNMLKRGTLPCTRIDGKLQVDREILDQLIRAKTV